MDMKYLFLSMIIGFSLAQTEVPNKLIPLTLPPEVVEQIERDEALKNPSLSSIERQCLENGGIRAYATSMNSTNLIWQCLADIVDPKGLQQEIEIAKPNGNLSKVFAKISIAIQRGNAASLLGTLPRDTDLGQIFYLYCLPEPKLKFTRCFHEMLDALKPCFPSEERDTFATLYVAVDQFVNTTCTKDGDNIAILFAEGGQECWNEHQSSVEHCVEGNLGIGMNLNADNLIGNISKLTFNETNCHKMEDLQKCVIDELQLCKTRTIANIVENTLREVLASTPCERYSTKPRAGPPSSASPLRVTMLILVISVVTLMFY